jgi:hypothetical protein
MNCACAILSSVVCLTLQYFSTLPLYDFRGGGGNEQKMFFLYNFFLKHFTRSGPRCVKRHNGPSSTLLLSDFHAT